MIRKVLCELIQRRLAGGDVPDDFSPKLDEINKWLDHGIAASAFKNYTDAVRVDGVEFVSESFYITVSGLTISEDTNTGLYYTTLPSAPYALPPGYDVTMVALQVDGKLSRGMVRKNPTRHNTFTSLPKPPNKLFYWFDGAKIWIDSFTALQSNTLHVRIASSKGSVQNGGLNDELRVPDDAIPFITDYVLRTFGAMQPQDNSNDGVNQR